METENRLRVLARNKRRRQRQLRRRLAGGAALIAAGLAAFVCLYGRKGRETGVEAAESLPGFLMNEFVEAIEEQKERFVLPERFDLREERERILVPDQGTFGTCWAFAALKAVETSVKGSAPELSADHMALRNSFGLGLDGGGDYSISSSYLLAWQGPVSAAEDPYGDGISPVDAEPVYHVQEVKILTPKDYNGVKKAVYEVGGVQSSFYMPQVAGAERDLYYREETNAFYYDGEYESNHDIVIVGWDDSYPKENFVKQPEQDGAFLCMNTWGESFGDRGYFYISYEDSRIMENCVVYSGVERVDNYDRIYQTDLCGWTGQLGYGMSQAWFANVYEAGEAISVAAAGFYALTPETAYKVYLAVLDEGDSKILMAKGTLDSAGYYTIPFERSQKVDAGSRFAVIVEIDSPGTDQPVAIEYRIDSRTAKVDIADGEGYISFDGASWIRTETEQNCNICLKAYARIEE